MCRHYDGQTERGATFHSQNYGRKEAFSSDARCSSTWHRRVGSSGSHLLLDRLPTKDIMLHEQKVIAGNTVERPLQSGEDFTLRVVCFCFSSALVHSGGFVSRSGTNH